eukprot:TRINITY_DN74318_c0_g1_i1.p1 TRINITY_DN74318_c0_g1~~TRINITY_DN74318_c0_g1_i1.p1  ORF type:complete len:268 (-),score=41.69 TRINITY_DN74318_c0_g1_i1:11-814(-)
MALLATTAPALSTDPSATPGGVMAAAVASAAAVAVNQPKAQPTASTYATAATNIASVASGDPRCSTVGEKDPLEIHFIGELETGVYFSDVGHGEGLCVDYVVRAGNDWLPMAKSEGYAGQTQTAYADVDGVHVFNHSLDFFYQATSLDGWPHLHMEVLKLDTSGCIETLAFGALALPASPGHAELNCRTWTPVGASLLGEARVAHRAGSSLAVAIAAAVLEGGHPEARSQMATQTSGIVRVSLDTVFRNASTHGILLAGRTRGHYMT